MSVLIPKKDMPKNVQMTVQLHSLSLLHQAHSFLSAAESEEAPLSRYTIQG